MRVLIRDVVMVDGTGAPPVEHVSLAIEDHVIDAILDDPAPSYDRAELVIEANGGFAIPGVLDHHAHGMTRGPLMIIGEPALSDARAAWNRRRLLHEGVTRVLNVDGYAVVEEARAASRFPGLTVMTTTAHTPAHFEWVTEGEFVFGGVLDRHHSTIAEQVAQGSPAIGEIGPGIDTHWIDHTILPYAVHRAGGRIDARTGRRVRLAAESGRADEAVGVLNETGAMIDAPRLQELLENGRAWCNRALVACEEALEMASAFDVPVIMHHTPPTYELVRTAAERLGPRLICAHSNFLVEDPELAVKHAQELRKHGALVDVMTGDVGGARAFLASDDVTHAMFRAGCVDLISTDYVGGYWDSMLKVVERAAAAGVMELQDGVRAVTGRVAEAIPRFAPSRGTLEVGKVADIVVTKPGALSVVEAMLVSGVSVQLDDANINDR
jgi:predicted amidohydrolase